MTLCWLTAYVQHSYSSSYEQSYILKSVRDQSPFLGFLSHRWCWKSKTSLGVTAKSTRRRRVWRTIPGRSELYVRSLSRCRSKSLNCVFATPSPFHFPRQRRWSLSFFSFFRYSRPPPGFCLFYLPFSYRSTKSITTRSHSKLAGRNRIRIDFKKANSASNMFPNSSEPFPWLGSKSRGHVRIILDEVYDKLLMREEWLTRCTEEELFWLLSFNS